MELLYGDPLGCDKLELRDKIKRKVSFYYYKYFDVFSKYVSD